MMVKNEEIAKAIILEQCRVIGEDLAINRARLSKVVQFNSDSVDDMVLIEQDNPIERLIESYKQVFGKVSENACRKVVKSFNISL